MADILSRLQELSCADKLTQDELDTVMTAIRSIEQLRKDMREQEREFSHAAREIAAEARWEERQSLDGDYGSY
jgi:hypothetical protein